MSTYKINDRNKVKRAPSRGHYDNEIIYPILDSAFVCHMGFAIKGQPYVIPTLYGRDGDTIFIHGASSSRMLLHYQQEVPVCLTVTHIDGLVLARSAFHHSMNYRSAVIFGKARKVANKDKNEALKIISDHIIKGRWEEVRPPSEKELKATTVLAITIEQASAKIRQGPPSDEREDYALEAWAGVVPMQIVKQKPIKDELLNHKIMQTASINNFLKN